MFIFLSDTEKRQPDVFHALKLGKYCHNSSTLSSFPNFRACLFASMGNRIFLFPLFTWEQPTHLPGKASGLLDFESDHVLFL